MPEIEPKNIAAQIAHRGRGNPPSAHPDSSIANCFPGLEFDFRNVWRELFVGIELHESDNFVIDVTPNSEAAQQGVQPGHVLVAVDENPIETTLFGPRQPGEPNVTLGVTNLEWTNAVATIANKGGQKVKCRFRSATGPLEAMLEVRTLFDGVAIVEAAAAPGALTQGLCSPWQADYRECGCYYWAASRPDFVNVEVDQNQARGHNWMLKGRTPATPKVYTPDDPDDPQQVSYEDLYRNWEQELKFIIAGIDED